jgi:hypothetical protein
VVVTVCVADPPSVVLVDLSFQALDFPLLLRLKTPAEKDAFFFQFPVPVVTLPSPVTHVMLELALVLDLPVIPELLSPTETLPRQPLALVPKLPVLVVQPPETITLSLQHTPVIPNLAVFIVE